MTMQTIGFAASDVDPFSSEFLRDPYPCHNALREAGPVVRLERYGIWAMARYAEVNQTLLGKKIIGGLALERFYPELDHGVLLCATEMSRREKMDTVAEAFAK